MCVNTVTLSEHIRQQYHFEVLVFSQELETRGCLQEKQEGTWITQLWGIPETTLLEYSQFWYMLILKHWSTKAIDSPVLDI